MSKVKSTSARVPEQQAPDETLAALDREAARQLASASAATTTWQSSLRSRWSGSGQLVRISTDKLYLVDADIGPEHTAVALEGISPELESWIRNIDGSCSIEQLLWDADSYGLDTEVVGVVLRRLSELGAIGAPASLRADRPMRVAVVGNIPDSYAEQFSEWNLQIFRPWERSEHPWGQAQSWDRVADLVAEVAAWEADLVLPVVSSTVFDALDLAFFRQLRARSIPHLPVAVTNSRAHLGPFVDFGSNSQVAGVCTDCVADAQQLADQHWSTLLAQLIFIREKAVSQHMLRIALTEAGRWATSWWLQDPRVAALYRGQLATGLRDLDWTQVAVGASSPCKH